MEHSTSVSVTAVVLIETASVFCTIGIAHSTYNFNCSVICRLLQYFLLHLYEAWFVAGPVSDFCFHVAAIALHFVVANSCLHHC